MLKNLDKEVEKTSKNLSDILQNFSSLKKEILNPDKDYSAACDILSYFARPSDEHLELTTEDLSEDADKEFKELLRNKETQKKLISNLSKFLAASLAREHYRYYKRKKTFKKNEGNIADVGAGFTCSSSDLFAEVMKNKNTNLFLIENDPIAVKVEKRIVKLLKSDRIKVMDTDARKIPVKKGFFQEIYLNYSLHEFSPYFYEKEALLRLNKKKGFSKKKLSVLKKEYDTVLREIKRILSKNGKLKIKDNVLVKDYPSIIWSLLNQHFNSVEFNFFANCEK